MSPLMLKLERAVANSINAREHRMRLENELATACNTEECRQHELVEALKQFRTSVGMPGPINDQLRNIQSQQYEDARRTPLAPDTTPTILRSFDGVRD
jgi:alcohol dehydrogenase class IV